MSKSPLVQSHIMSALRNTLAIYLRSIAIAIAFCACADVAACKADQTIEAFIEPYRSVDVSAADFGIVKQLLVTEGSIVKQGEPIAVLNDEELKASLGVAEAAATSRGRLDSSLAEYEMQSELLSRIQGLFDREHASIAELDRAKMQVEIALAQVQAARDEIEQREREVERIQARLNNRVIRSPMDGIVTSLYKEVGESVSMSDPAVAQVLELDVLLAVFTVPESEAGRLIEDATVTVVVGEAYQVDATIEYISPVLDPQSGTVRTRVRIENKDREIRSGSLCRLLLRTIAAPQPE